MNDSKNHENMLKLDKKLLIPENWLIVLDISEKLKIK